MRVKINRADQAREQFSLNMEIMSLLDIRSSTGDRGLAVAVAILLIATFLMSLPIAGHHGPVVISFLPSVLAVMAVCELITSFLLFVEYMASAAPPMLILAITYLYSGRIIRSHWANGHMAMGFLAWWISDWTVRVRHFEIFCPNFIQTRS